MGGFDGQPGSGDFAGASQHGSEISPYRPSEGASGRASEVVCDVDAQRHFGSAQGCSGGGSDQESLAFLYQHQRRAVALLRARDRFLLAWEMGTGKTLPILLRLRDLLLSGRRCLVIAPLSVLGVWLRESQRWIGVQPLVVGGGVDRVQRRKQLSRAVASDFVLTSYEIARIECDALRAMRFDCVVCDECHRIKRASNRTSRAVLAIAASARYRYALSGTPSPNGPLDIHGTLRFLGVSGIPLSRRAFDCQYAIYGHEVAPGIRKIVGYRNLEQLAGIVATVSDRVEKAHCLDLPERVFEPIAFDERPHVMKSYHEMRKRFITEIAGRLITAANVLAASRRLQQILGGFCVGETSIKRIEILRDLLSDLPRPVVVWTEHRAEAEGLARLLGGQLHHAGLDLPTRNLILDRFQKGMIDILVSTAASLHEGVDLTQSSCAVYYTQSYNLTVWLQSLDRIHRIGQDRRVVVFQLHAKGTIDEKIGQALADKQDLQALLLSRSIEDIL